MEDLHSADFEQWGLSEGCQYLSTGGDSKPTAMHVGSQGPHNWLRLTKESIVRLVMQLAERHATIDPGETY